jgi:Domain of unknown function (DUF4328)
MSPPPGYVAYGGPGAYSGQFQGIARLSKALTVLLWIYVPLQLISIFDQLRLSREAEKFLDGEISEDKFRDAVQVNFSSIFGLMIVPIAVLTMIWMYRMASNLRKLGRQGQTWAPGWGIASWFVPPCVVYAVPWLMFKELWRGSDPELGAGGDTSWKRGPVPPLVTVWWVLYGLVPLLGFFSAAGVAGQLRAGMTMRTLAERFQDFGTVNVIFTVVGIGTTLVYLKLVRDLAARHMQATREA